MSLRKAYLSKVFFIYVDHTPVCKNGCLAVWILSMHQIRGFHTLAVKGGLASWYEVGSCRSSWRRWVAIMKVVHMSPQKNEWMIIKPKRHACLCKDNNWSCFYDNFAKRLTIYLKSLLDDCVG